MMFCVYAVNIKKIMLSFQEYTSDLGLFSTYNLATDSKSSITKSSSSGTRTRI